MQTKRINPKMGFWRAKQGLSKHGILRPNWSHVLGEERNRRERRGKERRRGRRWRSQAKQAKVWNFGFLVWKLTLIMNFMRFGMDLWFCMIIILPKPRVWLGFHPKTIKYGK